MKHLRWLIPLSVVLLFGSYAFWMAQSLHDASVIQLRGQLGDSFGVLNSLFSGLGFAGLVTTIWIQQSQIKAQEQERIEEVNERRSLFNLNAAIDATEQARLLLADWNNDRRTWIEAARLLGHAKVLGEGVTVDCHHRVLEASRLKYRTFFSQLLENKTAAFFYGVDSTMAVDDAARASTAVRDKDGIRSVSDLRQLEEASIYRVWEVAQWPKDFDDPVGPTFSQEELERLKFNKRGLREYLLHIEQFHSISGELRPRRRPAQVP